MTALGTRRALVARDVRDYYVRFDCQVTNPTVGIRTMKTGIHPEYYDTQVSCGCGNKFVTRSTRKELKVDICNQCHPFYTGKLKFVDTAGRIDKFKKKFSTAGYASLKRGKKSKGELHNGKQ